MAFDPDPDDDQEELDDDETALAYDAQDDDEPAQDGAGNEENGAEGDDSDPDEPQRHGRTQASTAQAWEIVLAERNEAGKWQTVGEPVPDARFPTMDLAFDYATRINCRDFGKRFEWLNEPCRAWVAVRVGTLLVRRRRI
jgi:hypothetical protein